MNSWQMAQQLKHVLGAAEWADGSGEVVFGPNSVIVFAGAPTEEEIPAGFPFALITIEDGTPDPDAPSLIVQGFRIAAVVEAAGDPMGEHAMIGSARADLGKSGGAGLLEVSERVRAAVQAMTGFDGAAIVVTATRIGTPTVLGKGRHAVVGEFSLDALCTSQPFHAAPQQVARQANTIRWRGDHCEARFDWLRYRIAWAAGTTPPATPGAGTVVYTGTAREAAVTIVAGRAYAVFADYDPRGTGSPASSSSPVVGSYFLT